MNKRKPTDYNQQFFCHMTQRTKTVINKTKIRIMKNACW